MCNPKNKHSPTIPKLKKKMKQKLKKKKLKKIEHHMMIVSIKLMTNVLIHRVTV